MAPGCLSHGERSHFVSGEAFVDQERHEIYERSRCAHSRHSPEMWIQPHSHVSPR